MNDAVRIPTLTILTVLLAVGCARSVTSEPMRRGLDGIVIPAAADAVPSPVRTP